MCTSLPFGGLATSKMGRAGALGGIAGTLIAGKGKKKADTPAGPAADPGTGVSAGATFG